MTLVTAAARRIDPVARVRLVALVALVLAVASTTAMAVLAVRDGLPYFGSTSRVYFGSDTHSMGLFLGSACGAALAVRARTAPAPRRPDRLPAKLLWLTDVAGLIALAILLVELITVTEFSTTLYRGGFLAFDALVLVVIVCGTRRRSLLGRGPGHAPGALGGPALVLDLHLALAGRRGHPSRARRAWAAAADRPLPAGADPRARCAVLPLRRGAAAQRRVYALAGRAHGRPAPGLGRGHPHRDRGGRGEPRRRGEFGRCARTAGLRRAHGAGHPSAVGAVAAVAAVGAVAGPDATPVRRAHGRRRGAGPDGRPGQRVRRLRAARGARRPRSAARADAPRRRRGPPALRGARRRAGRAPHTARSPRGS